MEAIRPVARTLLRDRAYQAIRDAIVAGEIEPGAVVRDAEFAELLGLSRAPVREAFSRLVDEGLLESKPQSYTRVTAVVASDVRDAAAVVGAMHELVARTAVPRLFAADVEMMRSANERFAAAVRTGDVDAALVADDELHDVLVRVSGNRAAAATVARYTPLIRRLERRRFGEGGNCRSAGLHEQLIAACAAGDTDGAVRVTAEIWRGLAALADEPDEPDEPNGPDEQREQVEQAGGALPASAGTEGGASAVSAEAAGGASAASTEAAAGVFPGSAEEAGHASPVPAEEAADASARPLGHEPTHQPAREPGDAPVRRADR
ncbi:GntR family transcriptional regulator [Streptomyces sp. LBUM 1478]|uniref:GntR family transcriptional regulator n=1 Tax=Streptomyces scabiei TaxID=1930 RepID=UPI000774C161|nr:MULTISPECIES: GntR family transcriptional regulator [Streptomyces]MBP5864453.1 GntR family transcriptional regulator [Streptomyces sp. LBUM 1484]MBP5905277.1 GntR family transcriptional regulator [Streptomyces sp. LBUM 1478]MBP5932390.1 GntR family transcriptional regulator [Streptomyces sp. LBUM 1479]MBP5874897.1 GntR family transcriptional regulator [Streptomyces sp. LBUM 1477]MBP5882652.1 GntR family transcriptional regulator [Streptomyces sp. LBUM 1487]